MKKLCSAIIMLFSITVLFAQIPQKFSYQAVIRNSNGELVTTKIGLKISILQGANVISAVGIYAETFTITPNSNGLVSIELGGGSGWEQIKWSDDLFFIKTETDLLGGTNYNIVGTSQLLSVPYAIHSHTADSLINGITESDPGFNSWDKSTGIKIYEEQIINKGNYIQNESDPMFNKSVSSKISEVDTTRWNIDKDIQGLGDVLKIDNDAVGITISNIGTPIKPNDAVTKEYVDEMRYLIDSLYSLLQMQRANVDEIQNSLISDSLFKIFDIDGNQYNVLKIGDQMWMSENLKTTKYNNGDVILTSDVHPGGVGIKYQFPIGFHEDNVQNFGRLYTWGAVIDSRGICPKGWHVPTDTEWQVLVDYAATITAYSALPLSTYIPLWGNVPVWKESISTGTVGENSFPEIRNITRFSALPCGYIFLYGNDHLGQESIWWTATEYDANHMWCRTISYSSRYVQRFQGGKDAAYSLRCIKD